MDPNWITFIMQMLKTVQGGQSSSDSMRSMIQEELRKSQSKENSDMLNLMIRFVEEKHAAELQEANREADKYKSQVELLTRQLKEVDREKRSAEKTDKMKELLTHLAELKMQTPQASGNVQQKEKPNTFQHGRSGKPHTFNPHRGRGKPHTSHPHPGKSLGSSASGGDGWLEDLKGHASGDGSAQAFGTSGGWGAQASGASADFLPWMDPPKKPYQQTGEHKEKFTPNTEGGQYQKKYPNPNPNQHPSRGQPSNRYRGRGQRGGRGRSQSGSRVKNASLLQNEPNIDVLQTSSSFHVQVTKVEGQHSVSTENISQVGTSSGRARGNYRGRSRGRGHSQGNFPSQVAGQQPGMKKNRKKNMQAQNQDGNHNVPQKTKNNHGDPEDNCKVS